MEPAATVNVREPVDGDGSAAREGQISAELRPAGNKSLEDNVTGQGSMPSAKLKPGMPTPPRGSRWQGHSRASPFLRLCHRLGVLLMK